MQAVSVQLADIDLWIELPASSLQVFWDAAESRTESLQQRHASTRDGE